ncbi:MAG: glutamine-hydrolyzing carbamoyl-phosphate synthase small subunit [Candidatus Aquicultorales bacterium]
MSTIKAKVRNLSKRREKAILALEDGRVFHGYRFGTAGETSGEVVFNTSMAGYQEILTDPSYAGQIVTMTYPHIGNYGVNQKDFESRGPFVEGFVVRENSRIYSNWRAEKPLDQFLEDFGIVGIEGVDTRALTKHLRTAGAMRGVISSVDLDERSVAAKAEAVPSIVGRDLVKGVSVHHSYAWTKPSERRYSVVAYDFGIKRNILRCLEAVGCDVTVVPASTPAKEVLEKNPDGVFLSNGPGDPEAVGYAIAAIRSLVSKKPIFGICLGHQLLSLALGAKTYKLKFGHRGANHPVKNLSSGKVEITSQNHGFAVEAASLGVKTGEWKIGRVPESNMPGRSDFGPVDITHLNLNDGTVEGLRCLEVPAFSVQYHPEASPGPHDSAYLFRQFAQLMDENK